MRDLFTFDLQLFGEGGAGGSGAGTGAASANGSQAAAVGAEVNPAEQRSPARSKRRENPLANVTYGRQAEPQQSDAAKQDQNVQQEEAAEESFEDLIKGRFKGDFETRVQGILQDRLKGSRERESKINPIIERVAQRYGMDASDMSTFDLDALTEAIDSDTSLYEQEALEKGMDVNTLMKVKRLERMEAVQQREAEQRRQQAEIEQHLQSMIQQGDELKKLYPTFDLQAELKNPSFVRLTAPGVGVDVRTAYEVVHRDEMRGAEMQYAAQKSAQRIAASVQANARRPAENGMAGGAAATNKSDPAKLKLADFKEVMRRAAKGEKIAF